MAGWRVVCRWERGLAQRRRGAEERRGGEGENREWKKASEWVIGISAPPRLRVRRVGVGKCSGAGRGEGRVVAGLVVGSGVRFSSGTVEEP
jgi:hypothetical protein